MFSVFIWLHIFYLHVVSTNFILVKFTGLAKKYCYAINILTSEFFTPSSDNIAYSSSTSTRELSGNFTDSGICDVVLPDVVCSDVCNDCSI